LTEYLDQRAAGEAAAAAADVHSVAWVTYLRLLRPPRASFRSRPRRCASAATPFAARRGPWSPLPLPCCCRRRRRGTPAWSWQSRQALLPRQLRR